MIVFCSGTSYSPEMVDGIGSVFDKKLIYGGKVHSPITQAGNFADQGAEVQNGVAVLAIGGNCAVTAAAGVVKNDPVVVDPSIPPAVARAIKHSAILQAHRACGIAIAAKLLAAYNVPASGKLVITFGTQHAGLNESFAEGMIDVLPKGLKMVGGATGNIGSKQIVAGELVESNSIAILITGDFKVATANSTDDPLNAAGDICKSFVSDAKPAVIFLFEDHLRRNALIKANALDQEAKAIADNSAGAVVFGMHDSGEIGHQTPDVNANGSAMRTVAAAIIVPATPAK